MDSGVSPVSPDRDLASVDPAPIRLAGSVLGARRHVCAFFNSADEEYRVLLPFISEGFQRGEKAHHIVDPKRRDDHLQRLASEGLAVTEAERRGQFEFRDWAETYLSNGHFNADRMLELLEDAAAGARRQGFRLMRMVAHMGWAWEQHADTDDVLELEARANTIWDRFDDPVICVYDLGRLSARIVIDVMRTHPMVIIGGMLQENPFFVPPDEFLRELRARRAAHERGAPPAETEARHGTGG